MREDVYDEGRLRKYLLGELNEAEQQALEERLFRGDELFDLLLLAEDELIDEFVGGALSPDEHSRFDSFFLSTPDRRRKLSFAMALRRYVTTETAVAEPAVAEPLPRVLAHPSPVAGRPSSWWKQAFSSPYLRMAAAAVIVLGLGLGTWRVFFYQSEVNKGIAALAKAYGSERPVEARITGLGYAPLPNTRGGESPKPNNISLNLAERILLDEATEHPGPSSYHALGELYLAERRFDDAIKQFEDALKADGSNAKLHSDLGAALLEKGKADRSSDDSGKGVEELAKSLEHVNKALQLDGSLLEGLFNRALVHQELVLNEKAAEDWRAYLEKDSTSSWADEARHHLEEVLERRRQATRNNQNLLEDFLEASAVGHSEKAWALLSSNREKVIGDLLATYLSNINGKKGDGPFGALDALAYAGEIDEQRAGDRYTADLARFYRSASPQQLMAASKALQLMVRAQESYGSGRIEDAARLRGQAGKIFSQIGDHCSSRLATCWRALHFWELGRTAQSQLLLEQLVRACEADRFEWLRARSLHQLATVSFKLGDYSDAIDREDQARVIAERLRDTSLVSNTHGAKIEYYRLLGNRTACFREMAAMQSVLGDSSITSLSRWRQYELLASALFFFHYTDAGINYETEALILAQAGGFVTVSYSQAHLGSMYARAQRYDEAFLAVQQAYDVAAERSGESLGHLLAAYADIQMGHLLREREKFAEARERYERAIESHKQNHLDFPTHLFQAYKGRLACCIAMADTIAAEQQWTTVLKLMDQHRARIREEENRDSFFDMEQNAFDLGIDLAYSLMNKPWRALEYAEASRARSLLASMTGNTKLVQCGGNEDLELEGVGHPFALDQIQRRIAEDARLLEFAVVDDKLLIWVISHNDLQSTAVPLSQEALSGEVNGLISNLQRGAAADQAERDRLGRKLFSQLIEPIETMLHGCSTLTIVPDKILYQLPWDALVSPTTNKFLIEDYAVTLAPSASLFAVSTDLASRQDDGRAERVLSVGDPSFDRTAFPQLERLDAAGREAEHVAALYECRPLVGTAATKEAVRDELAHSDVAHFAVHCVIDEHSPMRSSLILARATGRTAPEEDGRLQAFEIYGWRLPRMRLAVLSACRSGVEGYYRGEGMIGMARAFLVARVPLVVASLWPVDSEATAQLMSTFHEFRKRSHCPTAEALCRAKRSFLTGPTEAYHDPYYWAAFQLIGGQARF